jgi:hypothetical protein
VTPDFTAADPGPGLTAFLIVGFLCIATGLLLWSMVRQMRKVPADLDVPLRPTDEVPPAPDPGATAGSLPAEASREADGEQRREASADDE